MKVNYVGVAYSLDDDEQSAEMIGEFITLINNQLNAGWDLAGPAQLQMNNNGQIYLLQTLTKST